MQKFLNQLSPKKQLTKQNNGFYNTDVKQLPENFANDLFHYEMEVEQDPVHIDVVNKLLDLYANAVEYYETIQHQRYLIFKNKTQQLLLRPNVIRAMSLAIDSNKNKHQRNSSDAQLFPTLEQQQSQIKHLNNNQHFQQKKKEYRLSLQFIHQQDINTNIHQLFDAHKKGNEQFNQIINKNLEQQSQLIQQKLQKRRQNNNQYQNNEKIGERSNIIGKLSISYENPQESGGKFDNLENNNEKVNQEQQCKKNSKYLETADSLQNSEIQIKSDADDIILNDFIYDQTDRKLILDSKLNFQSPITYSNFEIKKNNFLNEKKNLDINLNKQQQEQSVEINQQKVNYQNKDLKKQTQNNKQQEAQQIQEGKDQQQLKKIKKPIQNKQNQIPKFQAPQNFMIPF